MPGTLLVTHQYSSDFEKTVSCLWIRLANTYQKPLDRLRLAFLPLHIRRYSPTKQRRDHPSSRLEQVVPVLRHYSVHPILRMSNEAADAVTRHYPIH